MIPKVSLELDCRQIEILAIVKFAYQAGVWVM